MRNLAAAGEPERTEERLVVLRERLPEIRTALDSWAP
jgi:hypothetical protein